MGLNEITRLVVLQYLPERLHWYLPGLVVEYNWWETTADGQPVVYRFVNSENTFDNWKIIKEEGQVDMKEEQVGF